MNLFVGGFFLGAAAAILLFVRPSEPRRRIIIHSDTSVRTNNERLADWAWRYYRSGSHKRPKGAS